MCIAAVLCAAGLVGCGGQAGDPALARVDGVPISQSAVDHWAHVIARGGATGGVTERVSGSRREQALAFLIAARWLSEESARLGVRVPDSAVERAVGERRAADGTEEFAAELRATGQTVADVRLEVAAELARAAILRKLHALAQQLSERQVSDYFHTHRGSFVIPEARVVDLVERLPSPAAAVAALRARVGTRPQFGATGRRELLRRGEVVVHGLPGKPAFVHAIFAAQVGVMSPPMKLDHRWAAFVVRRVVPARMMTLAEARARIEQRLRASRWQRISNGFVQQYRAWWSQRTICRAGYVVPGCGQYRGSEGQGPSPL